MSDTAVADTRRLNSKPQDLTDAYGPPSNFLEIDIFNPQTVGVGRARFTTYEVRMRTNLPIFKLKESCVRRRYSDFEWLKNELERDSKVWPCSLCGIFGGGDLHRLRGHTTTVYKVLKGMKRVSTFLSIKSQYFRSGG
ncbi:sorting nexin-12 [Piliocolobus tephrosceles]|uniref:Sorting nexin 12 n=1 Tax=Piliocolobus tephrosceles TaxID=591936 RepID=A0A8C9HDW2_9PRIM|nr:sorting nexin-12 [Piliocolobus tephrosceles]